MRPGVASGHMDAGIFISLFCAIFLPFYFGVTPSRAEQEKARERRMAAHRMQARLLRLDI